jgi:long-chain acyl-CoA synthetase
MNPFFETRGDPDKTAIAVGERTMSYRALDMSSRAIAEALRELGLGRGDGIAILASNGPEFFTAAWAAQRSGLYYTPIGRHLKAAEIAYILADSGAKALFVEGSLAAQASEALCKLAPNSVPSLFSLSGSVAGAHAVNDLVPSAAAGDDIEGGDLLYTSGTTGRPKGVKRPLDFGPLGSDTRRVIRLRDLFEMGGDTVFYTTAPIYHAAPLRFAMTVLRMGATLVLDEKFESQRALATLTARGVTHSQWVPTMFVRLLQLPDAERAAFRAPAHRKAIHSGAPCAASVKRAMIDWWGPILHEYYSGTESAGFTHVTSEEWLRFPGTVGKPWGCKTHILSDTGAELGPGEIGAVYFEGHAGLAYHNDDEKTREAHSAQGWTTMGDIGFLNEDGYLFLCDRKNFVIVSGGVNIYPKEVEEALESHPAVLEAAVFGLPDEVFGECVQAVVQLRDPTRAGLDVANALHAYVRAALAVYKAPKRIAFETDLPRLPNGKLEKHRLRDAYRDRADRGFSPSAPRNAQLICSSTNQD